MHDLSFASVSQSVGNHCPLDAFPDSTRFAYLISGLVVDSSVELPSAFLLAGGDQQAEVTIREGAVPAALEGCLREGPDWQMSATAFLFIVEGIARFLISHGDTIVFQSEPGHDPGDVNLYLLGTCLAVLLQQRGSLVLHASAIVVDDCAVLFCGQSGAGKSTMAALMCQEGYSLLNDDTCSLTRNDSGQYTVRADGRMLKLWSTSLEHCTDAGQTGPQVRLRTDKFYVRPKGSDARPKRVGAVYLLVDGDPGEAPSVERLSSLQGTVALRKNAFRDALVEAMDLEGSYFAACAALQRDAGIYLLRRPKNFDSAAELVHLLKQHWLQIFGGSDADCQRES